MKRTQWLVLSALLVVTVLTAATIPGSSEHSYSVAALRRIYSGDSAQWPAPDLDSSVIAAGFQDIGKLGKPAYPATNPYSKEKAALGKLLFYDPRLSLSKQIACASCHDPELGWGDGRRVGYGHNRQTGKRNVMTLFNTAFYRHLFWDGRAGSLEEQVIFPVQDKVEMAQSLQAMVENVRDVKGYAPYFEAAFGSSVVTQEYIQQAIATFERSVVSNYSRFDHFVGGKSNVLSDDEVLGLHLFRTKARCINCHNTPLFSDNRFHNDGQTLYGSKMEDLGRYTVTGKCEDIGVFRTPSLREAAQTGPWMHHGNFPSLKDVIEYYNLGNPSPIQKHVIVAEGMQPVTSPILRKLNLTVEEQLQLEAFLKCISTPVQKLAPPALPG
jgi:cytochrome c peroxidase